MRSYNFKESTPSIRKYKALYYNKIQSKDINLKVFCTTISYLSVDKFFHNILSLLICKLLISFDIIAQ